MEFWQVLKFYKKHGPALVGLSFFAAIVLGGFSSKLAPTFEASQSVFVQKDTGTESGSYYNYDGYYSQQAAERFTDSVAAFLKNKDLLRQTTAELGLASSSGELKALIDHWKVKRVSPQLVIVSTIGRDRNRLVQFVEAMTKRVMRLSTTLNVRGDKALTLSTLESSPFVEDKRLMPWIVGLTAFGLTFLTTSLAIAFFSAFREVSGRG